MEKINKTEFNEWNFLLLLIILILILLFIFIKIILYFKGHSIKFNNLSFKKNKNKYVLLEIKRALQKLSKDKIGASIIFERNNNISSSLISEGIRIDSLISSDLIFIIFAHKQNQLHDGAMIIDNKLKIKSVGNFLSIKKMKKLNINFGSRHRAILSTTFFTDSIGVVVSETNGFISCFYKKSLELKTKNASDVINWLKEKI